MYLCIIIDPVYTENKCTSCGEDKYMDVEEEKDFNQALTDVGISPEKYITPDQLTAQKGKNIIVISLESLNF